MITQSNELLIVTGEVSGDLIGASLIKELKKLNPDLNIFGIGGERMKSEGLDLIYHIEQMAFLGFIEVIKHLPFIKKVQKSILKLSTERKVRNAVLIDYPGFNLSIAKKLKAHGIKVIYYVSPQIWAWGKNRLKKMQNLVDKMLVVFPFEKDIYQNYGIPVEFVGHPLIERIGRHDFLSKEEFYAKFNLVKEKQILLLMPGSRRQEVNKIFPESVKAAMRLADKYDMQVIVACADNLSESIFRTSYEDRYIVIKGYNYELLEYAKFGIIKSGTSTLEAGFFALPMIIVYRTSFFTYLIVKKIIKVDRIGMVNILLGEKAVPELIQNDVNTIKICSEAEKIISNQKIYDDLRNKLKGIKDRLGKTDASEKAAMIISNLINES